ncbi:MFS transporter [Actinoalloteichus hymeniacidonis]|uniref:Arabinose efflux permease family protein n=1 Tax=Actinoalloteichus hymeniacidonis TaxID=340345 RepID=A0AAC9MY53_9PSEU|nr:MFS transporter [Actinoalloteichus hymeniacidonis]AOS64063.1 arabinose efflux permease family protein [Actinoalloteichus hymeniacidonis]MBB5907875.1 MFS family permease [Actinoalloteichus hymeniacidonis]
MVEPVREASTEADPAATAESTSTAAATPPSEAPPLPLSRNRNYHILWSSLLLSELSSAIVAIGLPLLILAVSGSAFQLGLVSSVLATARMLANVPAGVIADRWDRKKVMLWCQGLRALAMGALAATLLGGAYSLPLVLAVAVIEGVVGSVFAPAEDAALPRVVHRSQLSTAIARNTARPHIANLLGPAATGFVFGFHEMLPFALTVVLLTGSFVALVFLVLPRSKRTTPDAGSTADSPPAEPDRTGVRREVADGFRWALGNRAVLTTLVWLVFNQLCFGALVIVVLAASGEGDVAPGEVGLMMAFFGGGGILGASMASRVLPLLPSSVIVIGFSWVGAVLTAVMALVPPGLPLGLVLGATAFFVPLAATTIMTYQMLVTPDELRGRLSGIVGVCVGGANALGPMLGAMLIGFGGNSANALLLCGGALAVVALVSTFSPDLRRFPTLPTLDKPGRTGD